ncbi:hypothetical protein RSSM_04942 [Rhodopirellula sallentina SM41]|uniref:Uncharacterized protein n=1 Tax=Rhodopirellula sallentina SM41 TaxID=1263870 RepID=M5TWL4_9BACT|nr:hypothetical protein RSSM_04942 [Rhodopirellula sallentina SM41]
MACRRSSRLLLGNHGECPTSNQSAEILGSVLRVTDPGRLFHPVDTEVGIGLRKSDDSWCSSLFR